MYDFDAVQLVQKAILMTIIITSPILLVSLVTGVVVGFFQSATQIQDQSLSFIPKLIAILVVLAAASPWLLEQITFYATEHFASPIGQ